ncbi:MAG: hypothetical protein GF401_06890 [Chitinivibrionales bacterium]|nr:hypothetical protein [Chitinivibrionales bacterium]
MIDISNNTSLKRCIYALHLKYVVIAAFLAAPSAHGTDTAHENSKTESTQVFSARLADTSQTSAPPSTVSYSISRSGRRIQLDGFLLEWDEDSAKELGKKKLFYWDALHTPEGVTGYFRKAHKDTCPENWRFTFVGTKASYTVLLSEQQNEHYAAYIPPDTSKELPVVEWIIPWDSVLVNNANSYTLKVMGANGCGDSISPVIFKGSLLDADKILTPQIKTQIIIIGALLLLFIILQMKTKSTKKKGKSPL